jgi:hypothetical protein
MLDRRANSIEYAAQLELIAQLDKLVNARKEGKFIRADWRKLKDAARMLDSLAVKDKLESNQLTNLTFIYECLISSLNLNNLPAPPSNVAIQIPAVSVGIPGQQGQDGQSAYLYFAWADDASGTGFTTTYSTTKPYLAFISQSLPIAALNASHFAGRWFKIIGEDGETANAGEDGEDGVDGVDGNTILSGIADPTGLIGVDGDFYINLSSMQFFGPRTGGAWGLGVDLVGGTGADGDDGLPARTILNGVIDPLAGVGEDGDFYINTDTTTLFGPKTAGAWPAGVSLIGTGTAGADGTDGQDGADGQAAYLYIGFADDDTGNGYSTSGLNKDYVAFLSTTVPLETPIASDFAGLWVQFKGSGGDRWSTYSESSLTIGLGIKTLIVERDLAYVTGQRVVIAVDGQFDQRMEGYVVSYNSSNGQLIVSVDSDEGAGTYAIWDVSLQAPSVPAINTYAGASPTTTTVGGLASGSAISGLTYDAIFEAILVPFLYPAFSSFAFTGVSTTQEVGASVTGTVTATWATSNSGNVATNSIDIDDVGNTVNLVTGTANDGSQSVTLTTVTKTSVASHVWRITGTNTHPTSPADFTRDLTINWYWRRYVGTSTNATLSEADIEALATQAVASGFAATYSFAAGGYKYMVWDDSLGSPTALTGFRDTATNLAVAMADSSDDAAYSNVENGWSYALVSVTNTNGITSNKRVYRTKNILGGTINIQVS